MSKPPVHEVTIEREAPAACCGSHRTVKAECSCGWQFNPKSVNGMSIEQCSDGIVAHKVEIALAALGIDFKIGYKERPQPAWARS